MILTYIGHENAPFEKGENYFAFEVSIDMRERRQKILYTVINEYGEIGMHEADNFEIKQDSIDGMIFLKHPRSNLYRMQLRNIKELNDISEDVNGVWGAYHDGNKEIEDKIHEIIKSQAEKEGFFLEKVVAVHNTES